MKQLLLTLFALLTLTACSSNMTYDQDKNCSERGKNQLSSKANSSTEADKKFYQSKASEIQSMIINKLYPELNSCYQTYLNEALNPQDFFVCSIATIKDGKPVFVDVADQVNLLSDELEACMVKKFQEADWSFINRKSPVTITQPIRLHAKRR